MSGRSFSGVRRCSFTSTGSSVLDPQRLTSPGRKAGRRKSNRDEIQTEHISFLFVELEKKATKKKQLPNTSQGQREQQPAGATWKPFLFEKDQRIAKWREQLKCVGWPWSADLDGVRRGARLNHCHAPFHLDTLDCFQSGALVRFNVHWKVGRAHEISVDNFLFWINKTAFILAFVFLCVSFFFLMKGCFPD